MANAWANAIPMANARGAEKKKKNAHGGGWVLFLGVAGSEKHTFVFFAPWPP